MGKDFKVTIAVDQSQVEEAIIKAKELTAILENIIVLQEAIKGIKSPCPAYPMYPVHPQSPVYGPVTNTSTKGLKKGEK